MLHYCELCDVVRCVQQAQRLAMSVEFLGSLVRLKR